MLGKGNLEDIKKALEYGLNNCIDQLGDQTTHYNTFTNAINLIDYEIKKEEEQLLLKDTLESMGFRKESTCSGYKLPGHDTIVYLNPKMKAYNLRFILETFYKMGENSKAKEIRKLLNIS